MWIQQLIKKSLLQNQRWLIPNYILTRRIKSLSDKSLFQTLLFLPVILLSFLLDLVLSLQANWELHQGEKNWILEQIKNIFINYLNLIFFISN
jgi:hypothetical protein